MGLHMNQMVYWSILILGLFVNNSVQDCCADLSRFGSQCTQVLTSSSSLSYYWSFNENLNDLSLNNANLVGDSSAVYVLDRFNNANGAVYLNNTFLVGPSQQYITGDFTVTLWANVQNFSPFSRFLDFGDPDVNEIFLGLSVSFQGFPFAGKFVNGTFYGEQVSQANYNQLTWHFLAFSVESNTLKIYIDGVLSHTSQITPGSFNISSILYIGKSLYCLDSVIDVYIDDLKIFNRSLTATEVITEKEYSYYCDSTTTTIVTTSETSQPESSSSSPESSSSSPESSSSSPESSSSSPESSSSTQAQEQSSSQSQPESSSSQPQPDSSSKSPVSVKNCLDEIESYFSQFVGTDSKYSLYIDYIHEMKKEFDTTTSTTTKTTTLTSRIDGIWSMDPEFSLNISPGYTAPLPNGEYVIGQSSAMAPDTYSVQFWNLTTLSIKSQGSVPSRIMSLFGLSNNLAITGHDDGIGRLWGSNSTSVLQSFSLDSSNLKFASILSNGDLVTATNIQISTWDIKTGQQKRILFQDANSEISKAYLLPNDMILSVSTYIEMTTYSAIFQLTLVNAQTSAVSYSHYDTDINPSYFELLPNNVFVYQSNTGNKDIKFMNVFTRSIIATRSLAPMEFLNQILPLSNGNVLIWFANKQVYIVNGINYNTEITLTSQPGYGRPYFVLANGDFGRVEGDYSNIVRIFNVDTGVLLSETTPLESTQLNFDDPLPGGGLIVISEWLRKGIIYQFTPAPQI